MDVVLKFLEGFNLQTLIGIGLINWGFYHSISVKLERHEARTDRLYEMFIDLLKEKK